LEIILKAWTEPVISYQGRYHSFQNVTVTPQPFQKPMPPIRVAATSPDTFTTTGRQGLPIFLAVRHEDARMFAPFITTYREAYAAAGHPGTGKVFLRAPGYIAATKDQARADAEASLLHYYGAQARLLADSARRAGVDAADRRAATAERLATMTYDEALRGSVFIGTPDSVSDQLHALQDELGLDGVLLELNCGGKIPHPGVMEATRLLCQEVMPRFH
jgi:alkanesulfonate monooxygenase SsuD/methylene tetrahydromethanopterin reductase-like flavin-dependent oxidoreductase (luciferase family)